MGLGDTAGSVGRNREHRTLGGFGGWGIGCTGFRVETKQGLGFEISGLGFRVYDLELRGCGLRIQGLGLGVL